MKIEAGRGWVVPPAVRPLLHQGQADAAAIRRALAALAGALRPGGVLALDLCDLEWGAARTDAVGQGRVGDDWAIVTRFSQPSPERFDREITT